MWIFKPAAAVSLVLGVLGMMLLGASAQKEAFSFSYKPAFPTKPITIIVPFAAGGPVDSVARTIAEPMSRMSSSR